MVLLVLSLFVLKLERRQFKGAMQWISIQIRNEGGKKTENEIDLIEEETIRNDMLDRYNKDVVCQLRDSLNIYKLYL